MVFLAALIGRGIQCVVRVLLGHFEEVTDLFMSLGVVAFECQNVVGFLLDDDPGNVRLAAHRVDGDDASPQFQHGQQLRYRRYFVGLLCSLDLPQRETLLTGKSADHVNGPLAQTVVVRAALGFSINTFPHIKRAM